MQAAKSEKGFRAVGTFGVTSVFTDRERLSGARHCGVTHAGTVEQNR